MAVNSKIEEVVKTVSNTIGELHESISGAIGDEKTPGTSVFEINNLLSIAENGIPYLGVIETSPLSFETSYNPSDGDYIVNSGGQIGYLGNVVIVPSQRIGIKKYFSATYPSTHVYGIVLAVSHTELESASTNLNATVSEQATVSDTFTNTLTKVVNHNFSSKNLVISIYDQNDNQIIPANVNLTDLNTVTITFNQLSTGTVVVAKGGHIVGGNATISEVTTVTDTFTSATSKVVTHNFDTRNILVSVYDNQYNQIIPETVNVANLNSVTVTFTQLSSGFVVVGKAGHIVSGSAADSTNLGGQLPAYYLNYTNFTNIPSTSYRQTITGSGPFTITHNLSEDFPVVQVYSAQREQIIPAKITSASSNAVVVEFSAYISGSVVVNK